MNNAYLKSGRTPESDECLTPKYAVLPIVKFLKERGYKSIHCPFDRESSQYVRVLAAEGFVVTHGHIETGQNFFDAPIPEGTQCIVSNPPFSCKDKVLKRLYELDIPFAVLLPQNALQGVSRVKMFMEHGIEYLGFDRRINYYTNGELKSWNSSNHFASGYFCKDVLAKSMILEKIEPIQEHYFA